MIIDNKSIGSITNEETEKFELNNDGGHLFAVLSELYSRPVESTIREISTNCMDAHIMNNCIDTPFIIKLPNPSKNLLTLCFRDFGPGLNHEQVRKIYKVYGVSTKTNDNNATGCLGLGSKSPFSITSTFYVKSYLNGKCSQYTCSMGNDGVPDISKTPIVFDSDEENGLEVIIPFYKEVDFEKILPSILKYFKTKPKVVIQEGELQQDTIVDINWIQVEAEKDLINLTETISINKNLLDPSKLIEEFTSYRTDNCNKIENEVIQLQIYYPIDTKQISDTITRFNKLFTDRNNQIIKGYKIDENVIKFINMLLKVGVKFHAAPGKIAFSPSREHIKYTDLTLMYMIKELIKAAKVLQRIIHSKFKNIDNYDKAFAAMFINSAKFNQIYNYFGLSKNPVLYAYKECFDRAKMNSILLRNNIEINSGQTFDDYHRSIQLDDFMIDRTLLSFKSDLLHNSGNFNYINIFGQQNRYVTSGKRAFVLAEVDPFFEAIIESVYRKNLCQLVDNITKKLDTLYEDLLVADLVTLDNISQDKEAVACLSPFLLIDPTKSKNELLKAENLQRKFAKMSFSELFLNLKSYTTYTNVVEMNFKTKLTNQVINQFKLEEIENLDKTVNISSDKSIRLLPKITDEAIISLALLSKFMDSINYEYRKKFGNVNTFDTLRRVLVDTLEYKNNPTLEDFPDIWKQPIVGLLENCNGFKLRKSFYTSAHCSLAETYNKLIRIKSKSSEKSFLAKIDMGNFDFDNYVNHFREFLTKPKINSNSIFNQFTLIKSKDQIGATVFITNVVLHTFIKFFPNEFNNSIKWLEETNFSDRIRKELQGMNIPGSYIQEIKPVPTSIPLKALSSKSSNTKIKNIGSPIYYFDFEIDEAIMKKLKFNLYACYRMFNEYVNHNLNQMKQVNDKAGTQNLYFGTNKTYTTFKYFENLNTYIRKIIESMEVKFVNLDFTPSWENYNTCLNVLRGVIKLMNHTKNDFDRHDRLDIFDNKPVPILVDRSNATGFKEIKGVLIDGDFHLIKNDDVRIDNTGLPYYYTGSAFMTVDNDRFQELQTKLFNNNKIVMFDDNLKINFGLNAFEDKYDFGTIQKTLNDSTIRNHKKKLLDRISFNNLINILSKLFPDYLFLKVDVNLDTKFIKKTYSIYPFLFELGNSEDICTLNRMMNAENNLGASKLSSSYSLFPTYMSSLTDKIIKNDFNSFVEKRDYLKTIIKKTDLGYEKVKKLPRILFFENYKVHKNMIDSVSKIIKLFGGKRLTEIYRRACKDVYRYYTDYRVLNLKYNPFFPKNALVAYSSEYDIKSQIDEYKNCIHNISHFLYEISGYLPELKFSLTKSLTGKNPNPLVQFNKQYPYFTDILENYVPFEKIILDNTMNYSSLKGDFDKLFKIGKQDTIVKYKSLDDFISIVTNRKVSTNIHDKINQRTKNKGVKNCKSINTHSKISSTLEKIA